MTIEAQQWLLDFVQFYRQLKFFEEYIQFSNEELAHLIMKRTTERGLDLTKEIHRDDFLVLSCDNERVWGTAFDAYDFYKEVGVEYGWKLHENIVKGWGSISKEFFRPENIKAGWKSVG